jgi:hypothetical protein
MANERYAEYYAEDPKSFVQGLYEESSTQKQKLGTKRRIGDREFIYCKMGATAGVAGQVYQAIVYDVANIGNLAVANANIGERVVAVTPVTPVAGQNEANAFAEGYLWISTGASNGQTYKIKNHGAFTANTAANITLYDKVRGANIAAATSKASLMKHPCKYVIVHPSPPTSGLVGVCTFPVTANYYAWLQCKGPCAVETEVAVTAGKDVFASDAANGTVTIPVENANYITATAPAKARVGRCIANSANDHWSLIDLDL